MPVKAIPIDLSAVNEVHDCGCKFGSTLAYLAAAFACRRVGYKIVERRCEHTNHVSKNMAAYVPQFNVEIFHCDFLVPPKEAHLEDSTVVLMNDWQFKSIDSCWLVEIILAKCTKLVALITSNPVSSEDASAFHHCQVVSVGVSWTKSKLEDVRIYSR